MLDISTVVQSILLKKEEPDKIEEVTVGEFLSYQKSNKVKYDWACKELRNQGLRHLSSSLTWKNLSCEDIEDAVQDSMIALITKLPATIKMKTKIARYFKGICNNKASDNFKKLKKQSTISNSEENESYLLNMSDNGRTSDELIYKLFYNEIIEVFEKNSIRRKNYKKHDCIELLGLRREGYTHPEIDKLMGKQDWSKQRQRRCLKKIREILGIVERKVTVKK